MDIPSAKRDEDASRFILGVDLDGVCADFTTGLRRIAAEWLGVKEDSLSAEPSYNYPEWNLGAAGGFDALYRYAVTRRNLFIDLPPVPGASLALRRLWTSKKVRIHIITYRLYFEFFHRAAVAQTIDWLDTHDFPYWDLCFMKDKAAVSADVYVEDSPGNVRDLRAAGKEVIAFINSTNRGAADLRVESWADKWGRVEELVLAKFEDWERARAGAPPSLPGA